MMTTRETTPAKRHRNRRANRELAGLLGEPLSPRERDTVAALLAGNTTAKQLGRALSLTGSTVRAHLYRIYAKAGAVNMTDLVLMAVGRKSSVVDLGVGDGTG